MTVIYIPKGTKRTTIVKGSRITFGLDHIVIFTDKEVVKVPFKNMDDLQIVE